MLIQQGDILIEKVEKVQGKKVNHLILQEGEMTGHIHKVTNGLAELFENGTIKYLKVLSDEAIITHEEHKPVILPNGNYSIRRVREYDHFAEEARNVID